MNGLLQDFRYAFRSLRKSPGFTAAAVMTLSLGSGANAAIFSIFYQTLMRPLPVPAPEQLVNLTSPGPKTGRTSTSGTARLADVFSHPLFRDLERAQNAFTGLAAHRDFPANVVYGGQASSDEGRLVSGSYFLVLQLRPALGRLLTPEDDRGGGSHNVVVLSHRYWLSRFGGSPSVINETIVVNGQVMAIVGVTPSDYVGTTLETEPQFYVPLSTASLMMPGWTGSEDRRDHWLYLFGRLKSGISRERTEEVMNGLFSGLLRDVELPAQRSNLSSQAREEFIRRRLILEPGEQGQRPERGELGTVFTLLFSVTGVVLLIACANVAGLFLVRAVYRLPEVTIRMSLGASRQRLVRHLLIESGSIAIMGAGGGLLVAIWTLGLLASLVPQTSRYFRFELDSTQFLFAAALSAGITLLIGVYPAFHATPDLTSTLRAATTPSGTRSTTKLRTSLATTQIALAMGLLVVATLLAKSLFNVGLVNLGIEADRLTTFRLSPELNGYTPERAQALADRIEQEIRGLPGVQSASASTIALLAGMGGGSNITVDAFGTRTASERSVSRARVGPDYFRTVGIPLLAGREFSVSDRLDAPKVAIVNESFARQFSQGRSPIGIRLAEGRGSKIQLDIEVVGLVADSRYSQIKEAPPAQYFLPYRQSERFGSLNFYVRSPQPPEQIISMIPAAVQRVDPTLPVENLRTMPDQLTATLGLDRFVTLLSAGFAGLAMLLAAIGLYGLLSFIVAQRRREIGVRIALGADRGQISRLVLARVWRMIAIGSVIGLFVGVALGQLTRSLLFGVAGQQPLVLAAAAIGTSITALAAAYIPARRAATMDPIVALRYE